MFWLVLEAEMRSKAAATLAFEGPELTEGYIRFSRRDIQQIARCACSTRRASTEGGTRRNDLSNFSQMWSDRLWLLDADPDRCLGPSEPTEQGS